MVNMLPVNFSPSESDCLLFSTVHQDFLTSQFVATMGREARLLGSKLPLKSTKVYEKLEVAPVWIHCLGIDGK